MPSNLVLRESVDDLSRELARWPGPVEGRFDEAGSDEMLQANGPLVRALMRAEAELLVADALAMQVGTYRDRTPGERRYDALQLVLHRLAACRAAA